IFFANKNVLLSQKQSVGTNYLIQQGIKTIVLSEKTNSFHADIANLDIHSIVNKLSKEISEIRHEDDRLHTMAKHFCRLENYKETFLVVNKKPTIQQLNTLVHNELKQTEKLTDGVSLNVLIPKYLSENAAKMSSAYNANTWVRFNERSKSLSIQRGEYLQVISHNKRTNEVVLKNSKEQAITWRPDKFTKIESFKEKTQEFCAGERIQFYRSSYKHGIAKGEHCIIRSISQNKIKLEKDGGHPVTIDLSRTHFRHFDYGYANTAHGIVHERPANIIAELPSNSFHTDKRRLFQIVSQAKEVSIYTDDTRALLATLERKSGDRLSTDTILQQSDALKSSINSVYDLLEKSIPSQNRENNTVKITKTAIDAVDYAVKHLSEREAAFTHKELMATAMQYALGDVSSTELKKVTLMMANSNMIVSANRADGTLWTTLDAINMERQIVALTHQDKGKFQPIATDDTINQFCDLKKLHPEQIEAIKKITQSTDRVLAIQGRAGTGKTTLMTTLSDVVAAKDILKTQGYELLGLAPTHTAIHELTSRGIPSQTLDSFLIEMKKYNDQGTPKPDFSRKILIIDEASMVSNRKMLEALKIAHDFNARQLIQISDTRQISSLEAGKPNELIQKNVEPIKLEHIRRQENDALKKAVKETYDYDFKAAFQTLKESIIEIGGNHDAKNKADWKGESVRGRLDRIKALVSDYVSYQPDIRSTILVITPGHEDRVLTNTLIREHLKQEGALTGAEYNFSILSSKSMSQVERSHIKNFAKGQIVRFNQSEGKIKSGDYFTITDIKEPHRMLVLKDAKGDEILWQVPQSKSRLNSTIEVFKAEERSLQMGDMIRWSRTDKKHSLFSSEPAKVTSIQDRKVTIKYADGKQITFDPTNKQFQHWDHNYALTVYAAQGATKHIVLALLESYRENLINQPAFLVALTRAVDTFRIYTDNIPALLERIEQNKGTKLSSLEVIGEFKEQRVKANDKAQSKYTPNRKTFDKFTIEKIVENLNLDAEKIATDFLGKPVSRGNNYLQFGSHKGSLRVTIQGSKQGLWNDFSGEFSHHGKTGGNMLQFLQVFGGMNKKEAIQYGAKRYGFGVNDAEPQSTDTLYIWEKKSEAHRKEREKSEKKEQQSKINFAKKLAEESQPAKGTIVDKYLKEHRGIDLETIPPDIRYHPAIYSKLNEKSYPAMLVIARNARGEIKAVQATYLDPKLANKVNKNDIKIQKQTFGVLNGASVSVVGQTKGKTLIAEGIETGLSLAKADPSANIKIVLGKSNFLHIDNKSTAKNVVLCLDNDGKNFREDIIIFEASKRLADFGKKVSFIVPTALGNQKQDYNDVIKKSGIEAIRSDLGKPISYSEIYGSNPTVSSVNSSISNEKVAGFMNDSINKSIQKDSKLLSQYREFQHKTMNKTLDKPIQFDREI
ncbi:MAG: AAA family ATPase, partial [Gammaproteobacteria bacterium]